MASFFTAGSWEKDAIFGAARKNFDPSYFVTALTICDRSCYSSYISKLQQKIDMYSFIFIFKGYKCVETAFKELVYSCILCKVCTFETDALMAILVHLT